MKGENRFATFSSAPSLPGGEKGGKGEAGLRLRKKRRVVFCGEGENRRWGRKLSSRTLKFKPLVAAGGGGKRQGGPTISGLGTTREGKKSPIAYADLQVDERLLGFAWGSKSLRKKRAAQVLVYVSIGERGSSEDPKLLSI